MGKRMVKGKGIQVAILAIALTALLLFTACAPAPPVPTGEKVVEIGVIAGLTGGAASAEQPIFEGLLDYVRYFNEEEGIPGVAIKVVWADAGGDLPRFISMYRKFVERGIPFMQTQFTSAVEGMKSQFEKDQVVFLSLSTTSPMVYPPGWVFCTYSLESEAAAIVLDYFMENWNEERPPRLQFLVIDGAYGRHPAEEATKYAERIGFEVLPLEVAPYVVIDATPQLLRIQEHEADLVYIIHIIPGAGPIMRDAERLGLQKEMQFAVFEWAVGESLIAMAPVSVEGILTPKALPSFDETEIPGLKTMLDRQLKYHGKVRKVPENMSGWVCAAIMCEAVKRALEEVGHENPDGAAIKRALERMDFDLDGVVRFTYGPEDRRGTRSYAIYQVEGGKIVRVTDRREVPILVPERPE